MGVNKRSLGPQGGGRLLIHAGGEVAQQQLPRGGPWDSRARPALRTVNQAASLWSLMHRCLPDSLAGGLLQPWVLVGR